MTDENKFQKVAVKSPTKREIALIAASEGRYEYEIVEDALTLYKAVAVKGGKKTHKIVPIADVIATQ